MRTLSSIAKDAGSRASAQSPAPERSLCLSIALAATVFVIVYPFTLVTHAPLTDLPFHAANVSILRHYSDPAWHFREQFVIDFLGVPYVTTYALATLFSLVLSIEWAMKATAITMLALLPAGLSVLFHGMKKSPLFGLLGLGVVWSDLTHWGFLNALGALGLYAMAIGLALLVVDRPTARRRVALAVVLVLVLLTHVFRFPFAIAAVLWAGALSYPSTRRFAPLLIPCAPSLLLFAFWLGRRPPELAAPVTGIAFEPARLRAIGEHLFNSYALEAGRAETVRAVWMLVVFGALVTIGAATAFARRRQRTPAQRSSALVTTALPLTLAAGHIAAYLLLPMRLGEWWYVYPREIIAALYVGLAVMPELPRLPWLRLGAVSAVTLSTGMMAALVVREWRVFERENADFREIAPLVPRGPKLFYLVYDHRGGQKAHSAYVHLPAWIQATHGGWLGFHFAGWGIFPVRYRKASPSVPPALPHNFEWKPEDFRILEHGRDFDTFLVRLAIDPAPMFVDDPSVQLVARRGRWWLYRRDP